MPIAKAVFENSAYRRQSIWIVTGICIMVVVISIFGALSIARFQAAEGSWGAYTQRALAISEALADLDRNIGYGGFIHNFKNLILRSDLPRYQATIERDISGLNADIDRLESLLSTPEDRAAIARIRATFDEYAGVYQKVPAQIHQGKSPAEMDRVVKVSDTAAIAAIQELTSRNHVRAQAAQQKAEDLQSSAMLFLELGGLVMLGTIVLAASVMITFQKRVMAANAAKRDFLASMSHEIRTPMNAILGLAYLLENANLPAEPSDLARKIVAAGRSLLRIIDDILDFSKIVAGRMEIERVPFYLSEVLDNLATIMVVNASHKDIELVITPPPTGDCHLQGDPLRLGQILINLVGNAIKFTEAGHVEVAIDVLADSQQEVTIRFAVRDTGIGITAEQQQEIFAPFSQADRTITRRFGGTGLGLTISRKLANLMGGELGVLGRFGGGSEFWFTLNFTRLQGSRFSAPEMAHLDVLIADDSPIARDALQNTAVGLGWKATVVDSGEEVLRHVLSKKRMQGSDEVLLVDWRMPGMDGLATARAIREKLPYPHHPIILMVTAFSREELMADPDSALADAVLSKPVTPSSLYDAVAHVQRKRQGNIAGVSKRTLQRRLEQVRVLVVDDSDINREVAQRILSGEGARVVLLDDGQQAVEWLKAHSDDIDLVLMDLQMPVMDGYTATQQIRLVPELAELPVVALTAGAFREQREAAAAVGMTDYIAKPFEVEATIALILRHVGRGHPGAGSPAPALGSTIFPQDFPGLAISRGMAMWKDAVAYRQYLRKFARDFRDGVQAIDQMEPSEAASFAHKLHGAAGSLALTDVAMLAREADDVLRAGADPGGVLIRLKEAMAITLDSIDRFAPADVPFDAVEAEDPRNIAPLLVRTLAAFNSDNPDVVSAVLVELGQLLPSARMDVLYHAVENFDFRRGEAATRMLAMDLGISLGEQ